ncbi:MAG: hypothetical protein KHY35_01510 [Bacteroides thetaiotaomicron]|uniref:Uncharacterized protein n=1 Tax=Bacteroides thetaiotaomicron TaxID=818 RepID=A0A943DKM1_BACT4|nr:hypothetical protein [Bacteroides thetaiotaomicron]
MATKGTVSGVIANMVTLVVDGPVAQNEICYPWVRVCYRRTTMVCKTTLTRWTVFS